MMKGSNQPKSDQDHHICGGGGGGGGDDDREDAGRLMGGLPVTAMVAAHADADHWTTTSDITDVTPLTPLDDQYREALRSVVRARNRRSADGGGEVSGTVGVAPAGNRDGIATAGFPPPMMVPPPTDAHILSEARQSSAARGSRGGAVVAQVAASSTSMVVSFQSPEHWKTTRRARYDDRGSFMVDNRVRTPNVAVKQLESGVKHDEDDDDSQGSSAPMQYIPTRHLQNHPPSNASISRNSAFDPSIAAPVSSSHPQNDPFRHHRSQHPQQHSYQSQRGRPSLPSTATSPLSEQSIATFASHSTTQSTRSRRSTQSFRSSTSMSMLHGEVINLEANLKGVVDSRTRRQSRGDDSTVASAYKTHSLYNTRSALRRVPTIYQYHSTDDEDDDEESQQRHALAGMEIGGDGVMPGSLTSVPRGIPIPMTPKCSLYSSDDTSMHGPLISWGIAAEYVSSMRQKARQLGHETTRRVVRFKDRTVSLKQKTMNYYRPPLSPRSRELKNLQYLQQSHKEKVGQWMGHSKSNATDLSENDADAFLDDEDFCDFLIILTPQEVYRFWADLLDFRAEHLGDSLMNLWAEQWRQHDSSEAASTNTTESRTTEETSDDNMRLTSDARGSGYAEDSGDHGRHDSDHEDEDENVHAELSTPLTGLIRRRGRPTTPPALSSTNRKAELSNSAQMSRSMCYSGARTASHSKASMQPSQSQSLLLSPGVSSKRLRMSVFERAIYSPLLTNGDSTSNRQRTYSTQSYSNHDSTATAHNDDEVVESAPVTPDQNLRSSISAVRRRFGNRSVPTRSGSITANMMSPPIRSLTRGESSVRKGLLGPINSSQRTNNLNIETIATNTKTLIADGGNGSGVDDEASAGGDEENQNPNCIKSEYDIPNQIIPRGIAARTNGMLAFLSALKRGIVLRRHRANHDAVYCKIISHDGGDTIQYQLIDPGEAMVAFKEQRVRYNRNLTHSSSPATVRAVTSDWSCLGGPGEGSPIHKFKVPDHVAAQRYREKFQREHGVAKRLFDIATKAANSGIIRAADIVAVHPASHLDPRHPGVRKGELGTASLRRSFTQYSTPHSFSLVSRVGQRFKTRDSADERNESKWYSGEGSELQFKILDFEAASEGEFWLVFRGFLLLHRDVRVGRFAAKRNAGIGGGTRTNSGIGDDGGSNEFETRLQHDMFVEPATVSCLEKFVVKVREKDDTYMKGMVVPGAVPPPSDYFLGFKSAGTQIWSRLRLAGLETQRVYAVDTRRVMIKLRCPEDRLTDVAEVLRLKMKTIDGSFAPFREDTSHMFAPLKDMLDVPNVYRGGMASLLRSKDRQMIIDFIIGSRIRDSGAELGQSSDVGNMIQARIPLHMPRKLDSLCQAWVFYWRRQHWTGSDDEGTIESSAGSRTLDDGASIREGNSSAAESLPDDESKKTVDERPIPNFLTRFCVEAFSQPLDAVHDYFGEQVTFYFAWLQHCTSHLLFLAFFGVIVTLFQINNDDFDHPVRPYFSMVVMLWTFIVLVNWRKRSNYLAYKWGSMDYKEQETTRPEFHGEYVVDPITNEWEIKYPKWKRWLKYSISVPITLFFTGFVMMLILVVHYNRDEQMKWYADQKINPDAVPYSFKFSFKLVGQSEVAGEVQMTKEQLSDPTYWFIMGAMPAVLGLCIPLLNFILMRISVVLNDFENYRTESEYRTHLIIKVFSFRFVSQFGTIYYYAFISTGSKQTVENGILKMGTSVVVYTTVAHWWSIFLQIYFSMFVRFIRRRLYQRKLRHELKIIELLEEDHVTAKRSDAEAREIRLINKRMLLDQAQDDLWFEIMNPPHDSFQEYIAAVVQFSFVACFTIVLPITPLLVLINYLLNMRFDAYKLCRGRRRPLAKRTGGIGIWEHLLHIVAVMAVLTNCWLIAFTNADFAWLSENVGPKATIFIIVAWEHVMLLIKYMMETTISPLPKEMRDEIKRKQHFTEQERYANMRLKTERSRRTKFQKESSFASGKSGTGDACLQDTSQILPSYRQSPNREPDDHFHSRLCTILSTDEDSVNVAGQLYEC